MNTLAMRAFSVGWKPKEQLTVSEWADAHRILTEVGSAAPGPWRTSRTPFLREIMDCLSESSPHRTVVLMKSSQVGGTEAGSNWLGYIMDHAKGPVAVLMPTEKSLSDWQSQKFDPMAGSTPAVAAVMAKRSNASSENSAARKRFTGGILYFKTAGSTAELKSTSLRYGIADEVDEWNWSTGNSGEFGQGDPLGLLEVRLTAFHDRKLFVVSSPTVKDASRIEEMFLAGDQRHYHVPCPHCGHLQPLVWQNVKWKKHQNNDRHVTDAWYVCAECGAEIEEHHKPGMLAELGRGGQARWVPAAPGGAHPSFHISALYSPVGLGLTWRELAQEWLSAQDDKSKLVRFINTRLGETWADRSQDIKAHALAARAEPYPLRTVPAGCLVLTVGIDVQDNRLELQVVGHGAGKRHWTLDYHVIPGNPAGDEIWEACADYVNGVQFVNAWGRVLAAEACAIDTGGHHTHSVYAFVRSGAVRRAIACKGASTPGKQVLGKPSMQDVNWRGRSIKRGVNLYMVGADTGKHYLYNLLHDDNDKAVDDRRIRFSHGLDASYFDGLVSETFDPRRNRWICKKGKRNEPLDTWVLALAASHHPELYLHKWRASEWEKREKMLEGESQAKGGNTADADGAESAQGAPVRRGRRRVVSQR